MRPARPCAPHLGAQEVLVVGDRASRDGAAVGVGMTTLLVPPLRAAGDLRLHRVLDLVLPGRTTSARAALPRR